jgi:hypothetical protein
MVFIRTFVKEKTHRHGCGPSLGQTRGKLITQVGFQLVSFLERGIHLVLMVEIVRQCGMDLGECQVRVSNPNFLRGQAISNGLPDNQIHRDPGAFESGQSVTSVWRANNVWVIHDLSQIR